MMQCRHLPGQGADLLYQGLESCRHSHGMLVPSCTSNAPPRLGQECQMDLHSNAYLVRVQSESWAVELSGDHFSNIFPSLIIIQTTALTWCPAAGKQQQHRYRVNFSTRCRLPIASTKSTVTAKQNCRYRAILSSLEKVIFAPASMCRTCRGAVKQTLC